jgi:predicted O-linked N-acetylglucosamine transferase (SPINDLY family)
MIVGVLENLPRHRFELFAYSTSQVCDHLTVRIQASVQQWLTIKHMDDQALARRIRDDRIDILIDLCGHNAGNRMGAMALQPAPLLVKWVGGLINTTGLDAIDYLLTDRIESPEGEDGFYTEKLIRLPDDYICYDPPPYTPDIKALPALANGFVTYGCFNNPTKVNDVLLAHWAELMRATPDSRLLLKGGAFGTRALARPCARRHGRPWHRPRTGDDRRAGGAQALAGDLQPRRYRPRPLALFRRLTTCEALLMGVPVVTLPGPPSPGATRPRTWSTPDCRS